MTRTIVGASAVLLALLAPAALTPAGAENGFHALEGEYYVIEDEPDLPPRMFIGLSGEAAQVIFDSLPGEAEVNECMGGLMKFMPDGGYCTADPDAGEYFCSFSIDLQTGQFSGGESC